MEKNYTNDPRKKLNKVSLWCFRCYGTGFIRKRFGRGNLDPRISIETCTKCQGRRKLWYIPGTPEHKKAVNIVVGLWPRDNINLRRNR